MRSLVVYVALALACRGERVARHLENAAPRDTSTVSPAPEPALAGFAVTDTDFVRPVLYTWTSPGQIAALRGSHVLLTATSAAGGFVSPFLRELAIVATGTSSGRDLARLLLVNPTLARRRYAWPAPFATVLGLGARSYGTSLIRIELRSDAWTGRFDPTAADPLRFVDAAGATVATADVLAHPDRIGAIFHVRTERGAQIREYVVCNEAMIAGWSIATPEIRAEVDRELAMLASVARAGELSPQTLAAWRATLAFDTSRYQPTPRALSIIAEALAAYDPAGAPLSYP
jgi:hypothetical protein